MMNYVSDEMVVLVGFFLMGLRFFLCLKFVVVVGVKLNNIYVSNSVVGIINIGLIGMVD